MEQSIKERLIKLATVIRELETKVDIYGYHYAILQQDSPKLAEAVYLKRHYAREGLKMAKKEWSKLESKYKKEGGVTHD